MFEMMLGSGKRKSNVIGSGGPEVNVSPFPAKGMFVAEITAASFVTGLELADAIGLTAGIAMADGDG